MRTALDSSILILLYRKQPGWEQWREKLWGASRQGALIICPVAFAEYAAAYSTAEAALRDLELLQIRYDDFTPEAAYLAGQIFLSYRRAGGPRQRRSPIFDRRSCGGTG